MSIICDRSDLPEEYCAHCRCNVSIQEQAAMDAKVLVAADPRWMFALYPGNCGNCGGRFEPDDAIRLNGRADGGMWIAMCCADVA